MANYVNTHVYFERLNEEGTKVLNEMYSRVRDDQDYEWFSDMFVDGKEGSPTYEESGKYTFTVENVGPKWCYFEDYDETSFSTVSAWSWPEGGVEWMFEQIAEVDSDFIAVVSYDDEMPNFSGAYVYDKDGVIDGAEWDYDEIRDMVMTEVPELQEQWDEDNEEFTDEGHDIFNENIWEVLDNEKSTMITDILAWLDSSESKE